MATPKLNHDDVLDALITDALADAVCRALHLRYSEADVRDAVERGLGHGIYERRHNK